MDIGIELKFAKSDLDAIQDQYKENIDKCFTEMLDLWLRTDPRPTLAELIAALKKRTVGFHQLAKDLEREGLKEDTTVIIELPSTVKRHAYTFDSPSLDNHPTYNTMKHSTSGCTCKICETKLVCPQCTPFKNEIKQPRSYWSFTTCTLIAIAAVLLVSPSTFGLSSKKICSCISPKDCYATGRGLKVAEIGERATAILYTVDQEGEVYIKKCGHNNM